jgi:hypothetical protein
MQKHQENTLKNEEKNFNGTPKPIIMGCYQKEAQS